MSPPSIVRPCHTRAARRHLRSRPFVEALEARNLLTTFGPAQLAHAYAFDQISFAGGTIPGDGSASVRYAKPKSRSYSG